MKNKRFFSWWGWLLSLSVLCAACVPLARDQGSTAAGLVNISPSASAAISASEVPSAGNQAHYPRIANLWGILGKDQSAELLSGYDLIIPYSYKNMPLENVDSVSTAATSFLLTQFSTKGKPELDAQIQAWWNSEKGTPGYACLVRDSKGKILLSEGWQGSMVNMTDPYCRQAVLDKNLENYSLATKTGSGLIPYSGIYWDLFFGRISWLGKDVDLNLDGIPDEPSIANSNYLEGVKEFLQALRRVVPSIILIGNEAPLDYAPWLNGRVFEWQLQSYLDGLDLQTWDQLIQEYIQWSGQGVDPKSTILMNAPAEALIDKYGFDQLDRIPPALLEEARTDYQRMRFGLASALMGDGLYAYDLGKMIHGQFWWYDEYGRISSGPQQNSSTLPQPGYLGSPLGGMFFLKPVEQSGYRLINSNVVNSPSTMSNHNPAAVSASGVWARKFDHGIVLVNPTDMIQQIPMSSGYCKLNGGQAPLFQTRVDDDAASAEKGSTWINTQASFLQFGDTVHFSPAGSRGAFRFTPDLAFGGVYEVFAWVNPSADQSKVVTYQVDHIYGQTTVMLDASKGETGWWSLGKYVFEKGKQSSVELLPSTDGIVVADALKWVSAARYNDGSQVSAIELQPKDGIILVDCAINSSQ